MKGVVALVLGAVAVALVIASRAAGPGPPVGVGAADHAPATPPQPPNLAAAPPAVREPATTGTRRRPSTRIRVRWRDSGLDVPGAAVALLTRALDPEREPVVPASLVIASGTTDASGEAAFSTDDVSAAVWVRERSSAPACVPLDPAVGTTVLALERGPVIQGRVRTETGEPVASATVLARPCRLPACVADDVGAWAARTNAHVALSTGVTDASGLFALPVGDRGPHVVRLVGDWGIAGGTRESIDADALEAIPGGPPVEFVVEAVALVQVRFRDASSKEPIELPPGLVEAHFDPKVARAWSRGRWRRANAAGVIEGPADPRDPSIVRWLLRLRRGVGREASVQAIFQAAGYRGRTAAVPLTAMSAATAAGGVAEVELTSLGPRTAGRATLTCEGVLAPPGLDAGPGALLLLRREGGGGAPFAGRAAGPGRWQFRGLPEGVFTGRLSLGHLAESDPFEVRLSAGEPARVGVRFDTRAWVEVAVVDEEGTRVPDAPVNLYREEGDRLVSLGAPAGSAAARHVSPETGATTYGAFNVPPGRYAITSSGSRYGAGRADVEAAAGEVHRVVLRLAPEAAGPR